MKRRRPIPPTWQDPEDTPLAFRQLPLLAVFFLVLFAYWLNEVEGKTIWVWNLPLRAPFVAQDPTALPGRPLVIIQIDADGTVSIDGIVKSTPHSKDLAALEAQLRQLRSHIDSSNPVFIQPAAEARFQRIAEVLSAVLGAGIENYALLEEPEDDRTKARQP
jgi:biopolymer transport protein ExbD